MKLFLPHLGWHVSFKRPWHEYERPLFQLIEKANLNLLDEPEDEAILNGAFDVNTLVKAGITQSVKRVYFWTTYDPVALPEDPHGRVLNVCMGTSVIYEDLEHCLADLAPLHAPIAWLLEILESGPMIARPLARAVLDGDREALLILADALEEADSPHAQPIRELTKPEEKPKKRKRAAKVKSPAEPTESTPSAAPVAQEVVLIGGFPASGKSTFTRMFVEKGYERLNRDEQGGTLEKLLRPLGEFLSAEKSVVLDNLFPTIDSRSAFVKLAKEQGVPIRFLQMGTSLEDAQFNASLRMMEKAGRLLMPEDHKVAPFKKDPGLFPVFVIYKYRKDFEKPTTAEGFAGVENIPFVRRYPEDWTNKAVFFDMDGTLRTNTGSEKYPTKTSEVKAFVERGAQLRQLKKDGYLLLGVSNQSGVAKGKLTAKAAEECFAETARQLGVSFEAMLYCPHAVPPISCYCRKPNPGLGVQLLWTYKLDPRQCLMVGDLGTDRSFAERLGVRFEIESNYFTG